MSLFTPTQVVVKLVGDLNRDCVFTLCQKVGYIKLKGKVAALMRIDKSAVQRHDGDLIDRAEVEKHFLVTHVVW